MCDQYCEGIPCRDWDSCRGKNMNVCPNCGRGFTTPQGLGLHFKHGKCISIGKEDNCPNRIWSKEAEEFNRQATRVE